MQGEISIKVLRRLAAAEGYLDLDMPRQALDELDAIEDAGPLEAPRLFLLGQALKSQERFDEAIEPLRLAAQMIPSPHNKIAWLSLSECFRHRGQDDLADVVEMFAKAPAGAVLNIAPILKITISIQEAIDALNEDDSELAEDEELAED